MASEKLSGFEKAVRSMSSGHGRRWERPLRTVSLRPPMRARNAGVAVGPPESAAAAVVWGFVMGRTAGTVDDILR